MRKDKIRNEYIRSTVKVTVRNEDEGGKAEMVWTRLEKRPGVCRKKGDVNGVTGKEEKRPKRDLWM